VAGLVILLVIAGGVLAKVVPSLPTADAVFAVVGAVIVLGFVIWLLSRAGGPFLGGWRNSGRMGN
jgi:cytosine/uracil/thiamine/allantoin permease